MWEYYSEIHSATKNVHKEHSARKMQSWCNIFARQQSVLISLNLSHPLSLNAFFWSVCYFPAISKDNSSLFESNPRKYSKKKAAFDRANTDLFSPLLSFTSPRKLFHDRKSTVKHTFRTVYLIGNIKYVYFFYKIWLLFNVLISRNSRAKEYAFSASEPQIR